MKTSYILTALLPFLLSGCATILNSATQKIYVVTIPDGARVSANETACSSPCSLEMERKRPVPVRIEKAGFETIQVPMHREDSPEIMWNWVFGLVGFLLDIGEGASYKLQPESIVVQLRPAAR